MNANDLARLIDHTILKAEATESEVRKIVSEAMEHRFASVCVNPRYVPLVRGMLEEAAIADEDQTDRPVKTCAVVGFPLGANTTAIKAQEAAACVKAGAQEIDMVIFLPALLALDFDDARNDVHEVVRAARNVRRTTLVKVILETAALNEEQIALGCKAAQDADADFVKTSTGFHPRGGATPQAVRWLRQYAPNLETKASGGIRDFATAQAMLDAGATRLGCSAGIAIIQGSSSNASY